MWVERKERTLRISSYNIITGRKSNLEIALCAMDKLNIDLGFFQETKLTKQIYTKLSSNYAVFATDADSPFRGGIALFYRKEKKDWHI